MEQQDLWGARARITGLTITYNSDWMKDGVVGQLYILPKWSKRPRASGEVLLKIDEDTHDVVPDLMRRAWDGFNSADPGYYIPRWIKEHLQDYQRCTNHELREGH